MTQMTRVIYSASLKHRFQYYDDGAVVGFQNPIQDKNMALVFTQMHLDEDLDPYSYATDTEDETEATLVQADDWVTIYERG